MIMCLYLSSEIVYYVLRYFKKCSNGLIDKYNEIKYVGRFTTFDLDDWKYLGFKFCLFLCSFVVKYIPRTIMHD